jgi:hypothetical protein
MKIQIYQFRYDTGSAKGWSLVQGRPTGFVSLCLIELMDNRLHLEWVTRQRED